MSNRERALEVADRDPDVQGLVTDRVGLEKPITFSGWANPNDRFCELCSYAQTAGFLAPDYDDGTAVCTTHARALVTGRWDSREAHEVVSIRRGRPGVRVR